MLTIFTFMVGGPFFLNDGLLYVIQYSGNPLRGEQMTVPDGFSDYRRCVSEIKPITIVNLVHSRRHVFTN